MAPAKKNRQNRDRRKGVAVAKSRAEIGRRRINKRASFVHNLYAVHEFFLSAEGGVESFYKIDFKSR